MNKEEIGRRIKLFMKQKGLVQADIARDSGYQQSNISMMITGKRDTLKLVEFMADKYNADVNWLISGKEEDGRNNKPEHNITQVDILSQDGYTNRFFTLFQRYQKNEEECTRLAGENKELMKQMNALYLLIKGE